MKGLSATVVRYAATPKYLNPHEQNKLLPFLPVDYSPWLHPGKRIKPAAITTANGTVTNRWPLDQSRLDDRLRPMIRHANQSLR